MGAMAVALMIGGVLGIVAVVVIQQLTVGQTTTSWDATTATLFPFIGIAAIVAVIVMLFNSIRG